MKIIKSRKSNALPLLKIGNVISLETYVRTPEPSKKSENPIYNANYYTLDTTALMVIHMEVVDSFKTITLLDLSTQEVQEVTSYHYNSQLAESPSLHRKLRKIGEDIAVKGRDGFMFELDPDYFKVKLVVHSGLDEVKLSSNYLYEDGKIAQS